MHSGLRSGRIAIALTQERGKTMGIVCVYLAEILLELTLGPISTRSHELTFAGKVPFPRAGHIYNNYGRIIKLISYGELHDPVQDL